MNPAIFGCAVLIAAAFVTDIRTMKIPNKLNFSAIIAGITFHGIWNGWSGLAFAGKGMAAGFLILLVMYWMGAVGAGDVKLFAGIGAWMGVLFAVQCVVYSVIFAGIIGLLISLWRRDAMKRLRQAVGSLSGFFVLRSLTSLRGNRQEQLHFPFMLAVLPGFICVCMYF
ncbi:prepilin peptidase CpaA [Paenibacillus rhizosphaerae]|uniref:Prepilin peptidase CpaA n=1 Tax=Paenibacillus rhizosphaerae TaxID=297318 RepID=A0A839TY61_9BACL|nr:A24 family peptidase [Paenibacillus rhizosphaerae]MBB3129587.1 prepilin peptidase CpaA [Paenibacillus rhizosphaerae]